MVTKLRAARRVTQQGIPMVIANGADPLCLYDIVEGKPVGTRFLGMPGPEAPRPLNVPF